MAYCHSVCLYLILLTFEKQKCDPSMSLSLFNGQVEYNFQWLQQPERYAKMTENSEQDDFYKPLAALNVSILKLDFICFIYVLVLKSYLLA